MKLSAKLTALQQRCEELGYSLRFSKGSFNSNSCVLHSQKTVVVNTFLSDPAKAAVLNEIIARLEAERQPEQA